MEMVYRNPVQAVEPPQVFKKELLTKAYADLPTDFAPTDDAEVVERSGHGVTIVRTDRRNLKITQSSDMALAGAILKGIERDRKRAAPGRAFEEAQW